MHIATFLPGLIAIAAATDPIRVNPQADAPKATINFRELGNNIDWFTLTAQSSEPGKLADGRDSATISLEENGTEHDVAFALLNGTVRGYPDTNLKPKPEGATPFRAGAFDASGAGTSAAMLWGAFSSDIYMLKWDKLRGSFGYYMSPQRSVGVFWACPQTGEYVIDLVEVGVTPGNREDCMKVKLRADFYRDPDFYDLRPKTTSAA